jgi:DNA invertase Pin-like site-specific DNA recombinase
LRLARVIFDATPMGEFIFHITAALAELERSIIRERTRAGLSIRPCAWTQRRPAAQAH